MKCYKLGEIQAHYSNEWKQTFTVPVNGGCSLTNRNKWQLFHSCLIFFFWKCFLGKLKVKSSPDWCIFGIYNRKDTEWDKSCASSLVNYSSAAWPCIQKQWGVSCCMSIQFLHYFLLLMSQQAYGFIVYAGPQRWLLLEDVAGWPPYNLFVFHLK